MKSRSARLAATAAAAVVLGTLAAAAPAAAAPAAAAPAAAAPAAAAPASSVSVLGAEGWQFIDYYSSKASCVGGGEYYVRHGYSGYRCEKDTLRGWALMVQD